MTPSKFNITNDKFSSDSAIVTFDEFIELCESLDWEPEMVREGNNEHGEWSLMHGDECVGPEICSENNLYLVNGYAGEWDDAVIEAASGYAAAREYADNFPSIDPAWHKMRLSVNGCLVEIPVNN